MDDKSQISEQMPQTIGRYQIQGSIGYGAMGAVYKAFDPLIKRTLAIKTIRLDIPRQSPQYKSFIERFYHEARISGTLSHPNIVTLFDIGEEGGIPYLAMEYVEGETIASLIEKGVRFNPEKVISLVSQIASAVDYAHSKGVIHRDIKPSNLILFEGERVKVTDFGIAKLVDAEMTQSGTLLGTPSYMSPEQAMGDKLDGRSDIFSLGVCGFEMLSGEQPFPGTNVTSILYKLVHVDPIEPANLEMNGLVPQKWHEVFGKVLAKRPDDRYQTATEFVQDLEYCLGSWFGSAMGEETVADAGGAAVASSTTASLPAMTPAKPAAPAPPTGQEATTVLPALTSPPAKATPTRPPVVPPAPKPPAPAAAPAPPAPVQAEEEEEDLPATVHMKAPSPEVIGKTVVMRADQIPAASPPAAPKPPAPEKPKPAPAPVASEGATVVMSAADMAAVQPAVSEATRKAPAPPVITIKAPVSDATLRTPAAPAPAPAPAKTPPRSAAPPATPVPEEAPPTATAPAPMTRGSRSALPTALILGGAVLVFLLVLAVALVVLIRHRRTATQPSPEPTPRIVIDAPPPSTPPPPPPSLEPAGGALHIESTPPGATVMVNGEGKGVTPLDLPELPFAVYDIRLELKGYQGQSQSVALTAESPRQELKLALKASGPALAVADVLSVPFGATVTVDGTRVGKTPLTDFKLKPGNHQFEISKEGYEPYVTTVRIELGKRGRVDAQLRQVLKPTPTPVAAVTVDPNKTYFNSPADVDTLAKKVSGASPTYPRNAPTLRSGEAVSASVSFVVTDTGEVTDINVVESGGKLVDEAVMAAIRSWKYSPAVKKGVKVKVKITFKQTFKAG